ncbi:putative vacuolar protein sorting-associated protein 41-like [Apostichopus japonicus]|uniref:Putative vacuolar protein sorting-associated protein 41-like n=1 Tax=Stichopus japonicus TaxID=307972 RepID=A0A2G8KYZ4_STIJA|nr:putative vacuolar protein sorting-associated protein 41-like [Apostichopus japonicus]
MAEQLVVEDLKHVEEEEDDDDDEEDEDETDDSQEEDDSDSDQEPKLKYERIQNKLEEILNKEAASCMAVHTKFLAIGTHWGTVHVLDHQGNKIEDKEIAKHLTTVNQLSLDNNADYIASCSDDGKVAITGLYEDEHNQVHDFDCPIKSVALDPRFSQHNSNRQFVTGGDKLVLHEKGFLGRNKSTILHQGEGTIRNIQWFGDLFAWANDQVPQLQIYDSQMIQYLIEGVRVFDMSEKRRISFIERDPNQKLRPEIVPCSLCWKNESTLLIGWAKSIKICNVIKRQEDRRDPRRDARRDQPDTLPSKTIVIQYHIITDFYVCGVAPLAVDLVVLAIIADEQNVEGQQVGGRRPQLKIISLSSKEFETVTSDCLTTRGFHKYSPSHYSLEYLADEGAFYIVSPLDIIVTKQRDKDDHIEWLLANNRFEEAMEDTKKYQESLHIFDVQKVGVRYIAHLISKKEYKNAASVCPSVLGKDIALWEQQVYQFAKLNQLCEISSYVPTGDLRLPKGQYEMILNEFLQREDLETWPSLKLDVLVFRLKHKDVFQLIHKYNLFKAVNDKIVMLMEFDNVRAVKLLIDNTDKVPIKSVVDQLTNHRKFLCLYLHGLFLKDSQKNTELHALLVDLYAEHDRAQMMHFLKMSNHYPLQIALQICKERNYVPEMVFLYTRMGNVKQALRLIIDELNDVDKAIDFCKEQDDAELWEDLIESSIKKPVFITGLLNNIGTHVDPIILIRKIEGGMEIPGLRDSLVKILQDYNLQISLRDGCKNILVSDCFSLMDKLNKMQKRGLRVEVSQSCNFCNSPIFNSIDPSVVVFFCHHAFHEDCLINQNVEHCIICHSQKRGPGGRTILKR